MKSNLLSSAVIASGLLFGVPAHAGVILGGSSLLDSGGLAQLELWLGQGPLALTNIFSKQPGSTSQGFHSAVDGKGPTFVVLSASGSQLGEVIVGGYNPYSWRTSSFGGMYNLSDSDDRTAFLFNLSLGTVHRQDGFDPGHNFDNGAYQTYNDEDLGPTFGIGFDLTVNGTLGFSTSSLISYADPFSPRYGTSLYYGDPSFPHPRLMEVHQLEVFSIAPLVQAVPEPAAPSLLMAAGAILYLCRNTGRARK